MIHPFANYLSLSFSVSETPREYWLTTWFMADRKAHNYVDMKKSSLRVRYVPKCLQLRYKRMHECM